jgi:hypothetical protein
MKIHVLPLKILRILYSLKDLEIGMQKYSLEKSYKMCSNYDFVTCVSCELSIFETITWKLGTESKEF